MALGLPPGARLLSADDAVEAIVAGDHPEVAAGDVTIDGSLVESLRSGEVLACRLADGRLAFTRPETS